MKQKALIIIIFIGLIIMPVGFMVSKVFIPKELELTFREANILENGCGDLTLEEVEAEFDTQGASMPFESSIINVSGCNIYSVYANGYNYAIDDKGNYEVNKNW